MKQIVVSINTPKGDEYRIRLSSLDGKYFSKEVYREILKNVDVITIELERIKGSLPTGHIVLAQIEEIIADTFLQHPNTVICFICDFLSPIPYTKKKIPAQQYRSMLFMKMFERYISQHSISGLMQSVLTIGGIEEDYYIHVIARSEHIKYVSVINEDIRAGYSK